MKRIIGTLLVLVAAAAAAQDATVTYLEGDVDIRTRAGSTYPADFGDELASGDRVITYRAAEAEIDLAAGGVVTVSPDTVFIIGSEAASGGRRTSRLSAAVGSFAFRFNVAVGNEPRVGSTTSVAGVRGTELRIYAGSDGTTRFEVIEGLVDVRDGGRTVSLGADQGVEVRPGRGPTNVFAFLEQPIDYSVWNAGLVEDFLDDPLPALRGVAAEMDDLMDEIERRGPEVDALHAEYERQRDRLSGILEEEGEAARDAFVEETLGPARIAARVAYLDFRFIVLSALSLDQYVVSRLAAEMQAEYFLSPDDQEYDRFVAELEALRDRYAAVVEPRLSPTDI